jgi:tetratricopeptide (TPR) repeat protein
LLSSVYSRQKRLDAAQACAQKSLSLLKSRGDTGGQALALYQLSQIHASKEQYTLALEVGLECLTLCQESHETLLTAYILLRIGDYYENLGQPDYAREHWRKGYEIGQAIQHPRVLKESLHRLEEGWTSQDSPRLHRSAEGKKAGSVN